MKKDLREKIAVGLIVEAVKAAVKALAALILS